MSFDFFSRNGKILPISEAVVPLASVEYSYGFGVYESIRVKNKNPIFLSDHLARLMDSAKIIGLEDWKSVV
jgi:Branched-chain amino acid aminotransferase/4-amino-4-deoxychorismate lyase